jgi:hypothetical protein
MSKLRLACQSVTLLALVAAPVASFAKGPRPAARVAQPAAAASDAAGSAPAATAGGANSITGLAAFVDDSTLRFHLVRDGEKYSWDGRLVLWGKLNRGDAVRLDTKRGGRRVAQQRSGNLDVSDDPSGLKWAVIGTKWTQAGSAMFDAQAGDYTVDIVYVNGDTDKETVLRTVTIPVVRYQDGNDVRFQSTHDDWLGMAKLEIPETATDPMRLHFHRSYGDSETNDSGLRNPQIRCSIDGQRLNQELGEDVGTDDTFELQANDVRTGSKKWGWARHQVILQNVRFRYESTPGMKYEGIQMSQRPGAWSCEIRNDGKVLRTLSWTVNADGNIALHPAQQGPAGLRLAPRRYFVESTFPSPDKADTSFQPDIVRQRVMGVAWPAGTVTTMLAHLPARVGTSTPPTAHAAPHRR